MLTNFSITFPLVIGACAIVLTLLVGCILDIRERSVPVIMWYPMLAVALPLVAFFYYNVKLAGCFDCLIPIIVMQLFFCVAFYLFTRFNLFGMADAKALIYITICLPCFPLVPVFGYPPYGYAPLVFMPLSVITNAVILNLFVPAGIFLMNLIQGNRANTPLMFLGFPVEGKNIENEFGIIMEQITEKNGIIEHEFFTVRKALSDMLKGSNTRIYTKRMKENPEKYKEQLELFHKTDKIWISYGVPFLLPITAGLISAILFGDILTIIMGVFL